MLTISRRPAIENGETAPLAQPSGDSRPSGIGGTETPFLKPRGDHEPCPCNALEMLARSVVTKRFRARHRSVRQLRLQNTGETTMTFAPLGFLIKDRCSNFRGLVFSDRRSLRTSGEREAPGKGQRDLDSSPASVMDLGCW